MSEWKISSNRINGEVVLQVYRRLRENEVDHSGNREYFDATFKERSDAVATAEHLNDDNTTPIGKWKVRRVAEDIAFFEVYRTVPLLRQKGYTWQFFDNKEYSTRELAQDLADYLNKKAEEV